MRIEKIEKGREYEVEVCDDCHENKIEYYIAPDDMDVIYLCYDCLKDLRDALTKEIGDRYEY